MYAVCRVNKCLIRTDAAGAVINLRFKPTAASISPLRRTLEFDSRRYRDSRRRQMKRRGLFVSEETQVERRRDEGTRMEKEILFYAEDIHTYVIGILHLREEFSQRKAKDPCERSIRFRLEQDARL